MTDKQKEALEIIFRERVNTHLTDTEFYTLLDFIVEEKQVTYIPQPTIPWTSPGILPCYGTGDPATFPPYRVTCEFRQDSDQ